MYIGSICKKKEGGGESSAKDRFDQIRRIEVLAVRLALGHYLKQRTTQLVFENEDSIAVNGSLVL